MKRLIDHPVEFPIVVSTTGSTCGDQASHCNLGDGCLTCYLTKELKPGEPVTLSVPAIKQPCAVSGCVTRCERFAQGFEVSILFKDATEAFKSKMLEQVCQIEHYRRELLRQGRSLDLETAAHEWIEQYSDQFSETLSR